MSIILKRKFTPGDGWQYVGEEEAGGGGGGSLPGWWTVDSTPGGENVEFAGKVTVLADVDNTEIIADFGDADGDTELTIARNGDLKFWNGGEQVFTIGSTGAATFSPGGSQTLKVDEDEIGFFGHATASQPEIPATPTAQDIADVLVTLGLATQAA